ncbi:MAG: 50S ribosome-binding GTPase [Acidobacteria bacterium]|nr:50S ribosome-binding GTPase [Acidobacteriota bacterium]
MITSAAGAADIPRDPIPHVALVGRSNVGKSSLINALTRRRVARTSAAPGKTRLVNVYRVRLARPSRAESGLDPDARRFSGLFCFVDLPGYGFTRGGIGAREQFADVTREYFDALGTTPVASGFRRTPGLGGKGGAPGVTARSGRGPWIAGVILAVDARHPDLEADRRALAWLDELDLAAIVVATKVDKLSRRERDVLGRRAEATCEAPCLPVSAVTGEGLDHLWKHITTLVSGHETR